MSLLDLSNIRPPIPMKPYSLPQIIIHTIQYIIITVPPPKPPLNPFFKLWNCRENFMSVSIFI